MKLLPFNFKRNIAGEILLTNTSGNYIFLNEFEFEQILSNFIKPESKLYYQLKNNQFLADEEDLEIKFDDFKVKLIRDLQDYPEEIIDDLKFEEIKE